MAQESVIGEVQKCGVTLISVSEPGLEWNRRNPAGNSGSDIWCECLGSTTIQNMTKHQMIETLNRDLHGASTQYQGHLLNDREVANFLRVSTATVRRWRLLGQGPRFRKLGSSVRYEFVDLEKWLNAQPTGGTEGLEAGR
jgi:hypothetical protein